MKNCLKRRILPLVGAIVLLIGALAVPIVAVVPDGPSNVNFFKVSDFYGQEFSGGAYNVTAEASTGTLGFVYLGSVYGAGLAFKCVDFKASYFFPNCKAGQQYCFYMSSDRCSPVGIAFWVGGTRYYYDCGVLFTWQEEFNDAEIVFHIQLADGINDFFVVKCVMLQGKVVNGSNYSALFTPYNPDYFNSLDIGEQLLEAKKQGYDAGYLAGKEAGIAISESGTFSSLITAVVDAPIRAITGLLNFEILGQNMLSFFGALLSLCLILFILKRVI